MRTLNVVLSALVLTGFVGGTALAADSTTPASSTTATSAAHATPVKHKIVKHKKSTTKAKVNNKTSGAISRQAPAPGAQ